MVQNPTHQYQLYPGYTFQSPQEPHFGSINPGYLGGFTIPNANLIPRYPRYPPPSTSLISQGYQDPSHRLQFIAILDLLDLSCLTNDPIFYLLY